ncbi:hypothetical protein U1Q18_036273, partial [Sarracenia purpurea var. burkii]
TEASKDQAEFMAAMQQQFSKKGKGKECKGEETSQKQKKGDKGKGTALDPSHEATFAMVKEQEKKEQKCSYNKDRYADTKKTKSTSNLAINKKLDEI